MSIDQLKAVLAEIERLAGIGQKFEDIRQVRQIVKSIAVEAALAD